MLTTTAATTIIDKTTAWDLLVAPTLAMSVAESVATVTRAAAGDAFRIPTVKADPSAAWVEEGAEIPLSDAAFGEAVGEFRKVAGLSVITSELAQDSNPAAAAEVGNGLARDLARNIDAAFFGNLPAPAPSGLLVLEGVTTIDGGDSITGADPFLDAIYMVEGHGAVIDTFVANPGDALLLAKVKKASGSNEPLLATTAGDAPTRSIAGVPIVTSPSVAPGTIWGIPRAAAYLGVREDATVETDGSAFFTSDRVAVRAKLRLGIVFPHPQAIAKITIGAAGA